MKKKIPVIVTALIIILGIFAACNNKQSVSLSDTQQPADGYDTLKGTWYVGAIYYKNKLIDISDNDALSGLYDTTFLAFREDGTFTYSNMFMYDGQYIRKESADSKETYLLKTERVYTYSLVDGKMVEKEKEDGEKTSYLLTVNSEDSLEFIEMDPMTGKGKAGKTPLIFELSGEESEYISSNKAQIKNSTTSKKETTTQKQTTSETTKAYYSSPSTVGERNALESAKRYLAVMPFSHEGLTEQLEYEGYSYSEAKYAADNCGADWYAQAVKSAERYLETMPFSKSDLISQLEYEGFTHEQAKYGVDKAYR